MISEKIRDNLTFNTFLQLEQITDEVGDFVVHLLTCLYSYAQLLPFDTTELTQRATFYKTYQIYTAPIVCTTQSRTAFFSELLETNLISYLSSYVFWLLTSFRRSIRLWCQKDLSDQRYGDQSQSIHQLLCSRYS